MKQPSQESQSKESAKKDSAINTPTISLPKGARAIRGIGEKFAANLVTGTGSMTVPIATSPGRYGFGPQLTLSYDSGAGNGPFGFGVEFLCETRKSSPQNGDTEESNVLILSVAEDLIPGPKDAKTPVEMSSQSLPQFLPCQSAGHLSTITSYSSCRLLDRCLRQNEPCLQIRAK